MAKVYINNGATRTAIAGLIAGKVRDAVDTENTISLTLYGDDALSIVNTSIIEYNGNYYDVVDRQLYMSGYVPIAEVTAENVLYRLNGRTVNASTSGPTTGTVAQLMARVLSNGPYIYIDPTSGQASEFSFGATDIVATVSFTAPATSCSRRQMLNLIAADVGGEVEVVGYTVNLWAHRGTTTAIDLLDTSNVTSFKAINNYRDNLTSYEIGLNQKSTLAAGDDVHIVFNPLNIDVNTRIMAIEYNPYNPYEVSIEVGDYEPDIKDLFVTG